MTSSFAYPSLDDELLASRAKSDHLAFAELYQRHFYNVYRYHISRTGSVTDAQDLTSQTFLAALEGIHGYRKTGSFVAWLFGIARRKLALKFRQRMLEVPLEDAASLPDPAPSPETSVDRRLDVILISRALLNLTPERAEALALCIFADLTAAEAGMVMGKSEAAIRMLLMRGLRDLRGAFAHPAKEK